MKYVNSNNSISSLVSTHTNTSNNSSFEELVSKLFSCNIVLVLTDNAKQFVRNCFDNVTFASILNQFASIANLHCEFYYFFKEFPLLKNIFFSFQK